jgi:hypothetical protein
VTLVLRYTDAYYPAVPYFAGKESSSLVPDIFPVAIDSRPFLVDSKSNLFSRGFEPRVRDSVDQSTTPGEAAINPQGLWRRGESSWHLGAGQKYADTAEAQDYRFYTSQGIDPWTKGQISLLKTVALSKSATGTNLKIATTDTEVYFLDGTSLYYSTNPYASSPTWTAVTGLPTGTPRDMVSDGSSIYLTYPGTTNAYGLWKVPSNHTPVNVAYGQEFGYVDLSKGFFIVTGGNSTNHHKLYYNPTGNVGAADYTHPLTDWVWLGSSSGPNAIYIAGSTGNRGAIYKITISSAAVLDTPVVALDLPIGEIPTHLGSYLNGVLIGTNKGVRFATADNNGDLTTGALISTSGNINQFTAEGNFVWFTWSDFAASTSGLGRLDLSTFTAVNVPAYASDLMASVGGTVQAAGTFNSKRMFAISGVGLYAESTDLVASGSITSGIYRWGIPDRKFVAKFDIRSTPLAGTVTPYISSDTGAYTAMTAHNVASATESVATGPQAKFIEASFRLDFTRGTTTTGPTVTRWMARAYASPARSQVFKVPLLMHHQQVINGIEYYLDVENELTLLRNLVTNPRVVNYQENTETFSVVVEDLEFQVLDGVQGKWNLEGICVVTMRSVQD